MPLIIIIAGLLADFFSKKWAVDELSSGKTVDIIKGFLDFSYVENRGAAFGIFQNNVLVLGVFSLLIAISMAYLLIRNHGKSRLQDLALSLIVAGALGNIYDRFVKGFVVDFIHVHYMNKYHFPTFNVADMMVVTGTFFLVLYILMTEGKEKKNEGSGN